MITENFADRKENHEMLRTLIWDFDNTGADLYRDVGQLIEGGRTEEVTESCCPMLWEVGMHMILFQLLTWAQ